MPSTPDVAASYGEWDREPSGYDALWRWSVEDLVGFRSLLAEFVGQPLPGPALAEEQMPHRVADIGQDSQGHVARDQHDRTG